jgi:hypothetical protein
MPISFQDLPDPSQVVIVALGSEVFMADQSEGLFEPGMRD